MTDDATRVPSDAAPASPMGAPCLQVRRVSKSYGATRALVDVSASFAAGEVHCLLGENGAGKSTLGKIIGGLQRADAGEVLWEDKAVAFANARAARDAGIAMVHQELSLAPDLSVRANLWLGAEPGRSPFAVTTAAREGIRAREILHALGLDIDLERRTGDLAVGVQQLIEIGKALMLTPRLVVFDEPTATLGAIEKRKFFDVLRRLRREGVAAILVTHHIEDVMEIGDRVSVMRNGALVDSFALTPEIDGNTVLERLTGRNRPPEAPHAHVAGAQAVLEIAGLACRRAGRERVTVIAGEIVGFYGVVGCGAEAIVRGIVGAHGAASVHYRLHGRAHRPRNPADARRSGIAYLPAGRSRNGILPGRSILENLNIGQLSRFSRFGWLHGRREREAGLRALADAQVKFADAALPITSLSGGNQQKVLLARALGAARDVLVLEEPTAGVDIDAKLQIHQRIRTAAAGGMIVVLLSSDLAETIALCDVVHTMYAGAVVGCYPDPQLHDQPAILFDVLGRAPADRSADPVAP
jgi:ribose transport system ATP-binding protein